MKIKVNKKGMTLVEVVIAMTVSAMVLALLFAFIVTVVKAEAAQTEATELMMELQDAKKLAKAWVAGYDTENSMFADDGKGTVFSTRILDDETTVDRPFIFENGKIYAYMKNEDATLECKAINGVYGEYLEEENLVRIVFSYGEGKTMTTCMALRAG